MRRFAVLLPLVLLVGACRGGSGGAEPASTPSTTPTTSRLSLESFVSGLPGLVAHSRERGTAVASAQTSLDDRRVVVVRRSGDTWTVVATIQLPEPRFDLTPGEIEVADITGDGEDDYLVPLQAASGGAGVVISADGGDWRALPTASGGPYLGLDPRIVGDHLVVTVRECEPDCASGGTRAQPVGFGNGVLREIG